MATDYVARLPDPEIGAMRAKSITQIASEEESKSVSAPGSILELLEPDAEQLVTVPVLFWNRMQSNWQRRLSCSETGCRATGNGACPVLEQDTEQLATAPVLFWNTVQSNWPRRLDLFLNMQNKLPPRLILLHQS